MNRFVLFSHLLIAFLLHFSSAQVSNTDDIPYLLVSLDKQANISLPVSANYRRIVTNADYKDEEHLYRVCTAKNKKTCGYWENVKTKKKVPSGATTYNKNKKMLIVKKIRSTDFGRYMTGNKKKAVDVMKLNVKG